MPPQAAQFCLGVAVLAAGAAARMGRPKLLLPWGTTSVLGHLVEQWRTLQAEQVTVVCAQDEPAIQAELDRLRFPRPDRLFNAHPERGMFSSIQCAAQWSGWKPALTHWTIVLGDQPHIRERTLRQLLAFAAAHPDKICQPARSGHRRHPLVLPKTRFLGLATSRVATLKEFLQTMPEALASYESDDAGLDLDVDTPADYAKARQLFFEGD